MRLIDADTVKKNIPAEEINARMALATAPTVDAEPVKHGHDLTDKARYFYCSECGYAVADVFEGAYHHDERVRIFEEGRSWSYCPNCGARMINEVEE